MTELPRDRATVPTCWCRILEFIEVKRGRNSVKRCGVVFTCLAIGTIHIEVAFSLDMESIY